MKFQYLKYFYDLCSTKSFSKTANNFFVSQPVISNAIKSLELYFDTILIERKKFNNHFIITKNGYDLLEFIKRFEKYELQLKESVIGLMSIFWTQKVELFQATFLANNSTSFGVL
ncbi:MAG: helix-turn-helix domain-containing protein [Sarcina sp.]